MSEDINNLKYAFKVRAAILVKDGEVALSDFDEVRTKRISNLIYYLSDAIKEKKDFEGMMVTAKNGNFSVIYYKNLFLAFLSKSEINFAFLKLLVMKNLLSSESEKSEKIKKEEVDEIEKRVRNFL